MSPRAEFESSTLQPKAAAAHATRSAAAPSAEAVEQAILIVRGLKVMLDSDLAALYGVPTGSLKRAVKRNRERFPEDFIIILTAEEAGSVARSRRQFGALNNSESARPIPYALARPTPEDSEATLRSKLQIGALKRGQNIKYLPYAFTEQGVAMLSSVLRSPRAAQVNIAIMRAFVRLRETLALHKELAHKLAELEGRIESHDGRIQTLFEAIRQLMAPPPARPKRPIGFHVSERPAAYRARKQRSTS